MLKFISLIPRRADVSREYFRGYYESRHAPLALTFFRGFHKYLRNHVAIEIAGAEPAFDVLSEFWYESVGELIKTGKFLQSDQAPLIRADEQQFMNQPALESLTVEEEVCFGPPRCFEAQVSKLVVMAKRLAGMELEDFHEKMRGVAEQLPTAWNLHRLSYFTVRHGDAESSWDALLFAWPTGAPQGSELAPAGLADCCQTFTVLAVDSYETDLASAYQNTPAATGSTDELSV